MADGYHQGPASAWSAGFDGFMPRIELKQAIHRTSLPVAHAPDCASLAAGYLISWHELANGAEASAVATDW